MTTIDLSALRLDAGSHDDRSNGLCLMEAVAWWAGDEHTDYPACVSPVLRRYGLALNDALPDGRRQELVRFVPLLPGTAGDGMDQARNYLALDWLVRTYTPAWLDLRPELAGAAAALRELPRIDGPETLATATPVISSAEAAAWDARTAAGDATRAAAWDAAWDATRAAAWAAAGDALQPTVDRLQTSAIDLYAAMIDPMKGTR